MTYKKERFCTGLCLVLCKTKYTLIDLIGIKREIAARCLLSSVTTYLKTDVWSGWWSGVP